MNTCCKLIVCAALASACARPEAGAPSSPAARQVANLHAFARLYGVLRWFHPSDAAAAADWDRLAIAGARRVLDAPDPPALRAALAELIAPIAPTVHLAAGGAAFPDEPSLHPADRAALETVAWQHRGFGDSTFVTELASKRLHRPRRVFDDGAPFAALWQEVDAAPLRGRPIRLRGELRVAQRGLGQLWLRVERGGETAFLDNMDDRPVTAARWTPAEITATVDPEATRVVVGVLLAPPGVAWYDDLALEVQAPDGTWAAVALRDPGFEAEDPLAAWQPGIARPSVASLAGWRATRDPRDPAAGGGALRLEQRAHVLTDELFAERPRDAETVDVELGAGLRARVPIALYARAGHTIGDAPGAEALPEDGLAGVADVIVAWSALLHFWPYRDLVAIDWDALLDAALARALADRTADDHVATLDQLAAAVPDGHAATSCPGETPRQVLPARLELVAGQVVVTASTVAELRAGDVVVSIDGQRAVAQLAAIARTISGSPQWQQVRALERLRLGPVGSRAALVVERDGRELALSVARGEQWSLPPTRPSLERFPDGTYYVDLSRAAPDELRQALPQLAAAPGVVFDVRDRPLPVRDLLTHLIDAPIDLAAGGSYPHVIRPGFPASTTWEHEPVVLSPAAPRFTGRIAFVTGPTAISYAELVLAAVDSFRLGAIVGAATAGTDGSRADVGLPSRCTISFTAVRFVRANGARFHLVGVQPTHRAERTLAGIRAGRDELVETALAIVRRRSD